jgi:curved DNA-binding protein
MSSDLYAELGVSKNASPEEIKRAYRKLAAKFHPDRNPDSSSAETRFKSINRAHDVLSNKEKRALYDEFGEAGLREGFSPDLARGGRGFGGKGRGPFGGGGLDDLFGGGGQFTGFGDLFGDVFRSRGQNKGQDVTAEVLVDFVSAIRGANVTVNVPGAAQAVTVRVPPGAGDGDKVRVAGRGAPHGRGGAAGDLLLRIKVQPHRFFERDGLDLHLDVPISVGEAYHGARIRIPTPDGDVTFKVPDHARSGQVIRLKGKGVRRQNRVGDLYAKLLIQLPQSKNKKLAQAVDVLAQASDLSDRDKISF